MTTPRVHEILPANSTHGQQTPSHPDGEIKSYADFKGRPQISVDGPKGHILVTRRDDFQRTPFEVWRSDQLSAITRTSDRNRAVKVACVAAGLDPALLVF